MATSREKTRWHNVAAIPVAITEAIQEKDAQTNRICRMNQDIGQLGICAKPFPTLQRSQINLNFPLFWWHIYMEDSTSPSAEAVSRPREA